MIGKEDFKMNEIKAIVDSSQADTRDGLIDFLKPITMREAKGRLTDSEIQINDRLRDIVRRIIIDDDAYLRDDTSRYNLMMSGIGDYMSDWGMLMMSIDDHYDNRSGSNVVARYLWNKKEPKPNPLKW